MNMQVMNNVHCILSKKRQNATVGKDWRGVVLNCGSAFLGPYGQWTNCLRDLFSIVKCCSAVSTVDANLLFNTGLNSWKPGVELWTLNTEHELVNKRQTQQWRHQRSAHTTLKPEPEPTNKQWHQSMWHTYCCHTTNHTYSIGCSGIKRPESISCRMIDFTQQYFV